MGDMEQRVENNILLDFYGPLLTEHRREVMRLYCEEDLSLAEIAGQLQITRQGVSDTINKARRQLADYENKLGLAARYRRLVKQAAQCLSALDAISAENPSTEALARAKRALQEMIQNER